jgi:peptidoglycan/LPS O-acetylase OafA/YrhL
VYGPREFADLSRRAFYAVFALALATSFGAVLAVTLELDDFDGAYSAFGQNLMMSVLFLAMLYARRSLRGQSVSIALLKMGGTALASFAFYFYNPEYDGSVLLPFLYVAILVFDGIYAGAVIVRRRQKGHNSLAG